MDTQSLRRKILAQIEALPAERVAEVGDFIDFIAKREGRKSCSAESILLRATSAFNTTSFERVWDNPEDAAYDRL